MRKDFLENVVQCKDGRYRIKIPWIDERIPSKTSVVQSKLRLCDFFRKMKDETRKEYDAIIIEQLELGIIEEAPVEPTGKRVYYIPHKPVIRESVASTKIRMVFYAACKPTVTDFSINEYMNPGPPIQPLFSDILIRSRIAPVCIVGDVPKAFLQIELHEEDRDAFSFIYKLTDEPEKKFRFKRLSFRGESSPLVLGGVLQNHLEKTEGDEKIKLDLMHNTYVDNLLGLTPKEADAEKFKVESSKIIEKGEFPLGKWESNIKILNDNDKVETKLLGILCNKCDVSYAIEIELKEVETVTKRLMLKTLACIYNPLGIISPMIVEGKHLYRQAVDEKKGWDKQVSERLKNNWNKWVRNLNTFKVPRSIAPYFEDIIQVYLHHFMDASDKTVSAQTVVVVA